MRSKTREESKRDCTYASSFLATSSTPVSNQFMTPFLYLFPLSTEGADAMMWRLQASSFSESGPHPTQPSMTVDGLSQPDIQQRRTKSVTHTSNSGSAQHHRAHKRDAAGISAVPAYHPDYDESAQHEYGGGEVDYDHDDGVRFSEREKVRQRMPFGRRGSEGYDTRYGPSIANSHRGMYRRSCAEDGHCCQHVPESEGESGWEEDVGVQVQEERELR
jgi:guanyl-specific ribonuclease Sa